jgi:Flp pilus assembly protein TadB
MDRDKQKQEISLIGRLFSLEALLIIMGLLSLVAGFIARDLLRFSFGVIILGGATLAIVLRRKQRSRNSANNPHRRKDD